MLLQTSSCSQGQLSTFRRAGSAKHRAQATSGRPPWLGQASWAQLGWGLGCPFHDQTGPAPPGPAFQEHLPACRLAS